MFIVNLSMSCVVVFIDCSLDVLENVYWALELE